MINNTNTPHGWVGNTLCIKQTASGSVASFADGADQYPVNDLTVNIEPVQSGSGDPSPDNVRPISGWTGMNVQRTGKNLIGWVPGTQRTSAGVQYTVNADGSISCVGTATGSTWGPGDSTHVLLKPGTYVATIRGNTNIRFVVVNDSVTPNIVINTEGGVFTLTQDTIVHVYISGSNGATFNETVYVQLELGSTATDYEPYTEEAYPITFPSEVGTIYGGTLDVTTGVLTADRAMVIVGTDTGELRNNSKTSITTRAFFTANVPKAYGMYNFISDKFVINNIGDAVGKMSGRSASSGIEFYLPLTVPDTNEGVQAWFADNPTQLCYELATPQTYHLTPIEVMTLLGQNNIFADTGSVDVTYIADSTITMNNIKNAITSLGGNV